MAQNSNTDKGIFLDTHPIDIDDTPLDAHTITVRVLPPPPTLQSSLRRTSKCLQNLGGDKQDLSPIRVRWCASTRQDPAETLSVRRRAFRRLRDASLSNHACGLSQDERSIARCLEEADLLPAANLERLKYLLYALPAAPWVPTRYPVVFDVKAVLEVMGSLQRAYRWWHVRLNFVITFIPRISLSEVLQQLIRLHGSDAAAAGFHRVNDRNPLYPLVLFLPGEPRALEPPHCDILTDSSQSRTNEELRSVSTTTDSDCEDFRPSRGPAIPKIEINHIKEWCSVLTILRDNNAWSSLLCSLIDEGLGMIAAQGLIAHECSPRGGWEAYCNGPGGGSSMPSSIQSAY